MDRRAVSSLSVVGRARVDRGLRRPERGGGAALGRLGRGLGAPRLGRPTPGVEERAAGTLERGLQVGDPPRRILDVLLGVPRGIPGGAGLARRVVDPDARLLEGLAGASDREVVPRQLPGARQPRRRARERGVGVTEAETGGRRELLGEATNDEDGLQLGIERRAVERGFDRGPLRGGVVGQRRGRVGQVVEQGAPLAAGGSQVGVRPCGRPPLRLLDLGARRDELGDLAGAAPGDLVDAPCDNGRAPERMDGRGLVLVAGLSQLARQCLAARRRTRRRAARRARRRAVAGRPRSSRLRRLAARGASIPRARGGRRRGRRPCGEARRAPRRS